MIITYYGLQFLKFQLGDLVLAVNPASQKSLAQSGGKNVRFGADIALVSLNHPDFNNPDALSYGERAPFVINGPGEYEIKGIAIRGYGVPTQHEGKEAINTLYYLSFDGVLICILGALNSSADLKEEILEKIGNVDILFVSVGKGSLSPGDAHKASLLFEPKVIVPLASDVSALKKFFEEIGEEEVKPVEKLTLKKKDLEEKEGEVLVLKATQ